MPGAMAIFLKRPPTPVRVYAVIQIISCCYYGLYEQSASEIEYRIAYVLLTLLATTLAGWEVCRVYASRGARLFGLLCGALTLLTVQELIPDADFDTRIVLVQAVGATAICTSLSVALRKTPEKLIPATFAALFGGIALFWIGISLKPSLQGSWDWVAPVWMHTAAYSWVGWKLRWADSSLSHPTQPVDRHS